MTIYAIYIAYYDKSTFSLPKRTYNHNMFLLFVRLPDSRPVQGASISESSQVKQVQSLCYFYLMYRSMRKYV